MKSFLEFTDLMGFYQFRIGRLIIRWEKKIVHVVEKRKSTIIQKFLDDERGRGGKFNMRGGEFDGMGKVYFQMQNMR